MFSLKHLFTFFFFFNFENVKDNNNKTDLTSLNEMEIVSKLTPNPCLRMEGGFLSLPINQLSQQW